MYGRICAGVKLGGEDVEEAIGELEGSRKLGAGSS
jgi:hypothetical protein